MTTGQMSSHDVFILDCESDCDHSCCASREVHSEIYVHTNPFQHIVFTTIMSTHKFHDMISDCGQPHRSSCCMDIVMEGPACSFKPYCD